MVKTLVQLRQERDSLLNKSNVSKLKSNKKNQERLEAVQLKREILLLKHPGLTRAGESVRRELDRFGKGTVKFVRRRAEIIRANLDEMEREQRRPIKRKTVKKKLVVRKTTRRRIRR